MDIVGLIICGVVLGVILWWDDREYRRGTQEKHIKKKHQKIIHYEIRML